MISIDALAAQMSGVATASVENLYQHSVSFLIFYFGLMIVTKKRSVLITERFL